MCSCPRAPAFSRFVMIRPIHSARPRSSEHCFCAGQGAAPQDAVPGAFVVQADRRVVEEILLDLGEQVGEGAGVHRDHEAVVTA